MMNMLLLTKFNMYKLILSKPSGYARGLFCAKKIYVNGDSRADATDTKLIPYIGDIRLSPFFIFGFFCDIMMELRQSDK